jgi:hypothetical protein
MKVFSIQISDEPKRQKYFRYGEILKIVYKNGDEVYGGKKIVHFSGRTRVEDDLDNLKKIVIESHFQKKETELYPNFLEVRWSFHCADEQTRIFLDKERINYKSIPVDIINESNHSYKVIFFEEKADLVALDESNSYIDERGFLRSIGKDYFNPVLSNLTLKPSSLNIKGIVSLREISELLCDEETKNKLEKSGLTGFYFEELKVIE